MLFSVAVSAVAQNDGDDKNTGSRLEAMKIAWLTKKLELSPEEAQKFWPIYNQYTKEIQQTRKDAREKKEREEQMTPERRAEVKAVEKAAAKKEAETQRKRPSLLKPGEGEKK